VCAVQVIADTIMNDIISLGYPSNTDELEADLTSQITSAVLHVQHMEISRLKQLFAKFALPLLTPEEVDAVKEARVRPQSFCC
jgi:hypothetical protein